LGEGSIDIMWDGEGAAAWLAGGLDGELAPLVLQPAKATAAAAVSAIDLSFT
jgi:hypothetical protein